MPERDQLSVVPGFSHPHSRHHSIFLSHTRLGRQPVAQAGLRLCTFAFAVIQSPLQGPKDPSSRFTAPLPPPLTPSDPTQYHPSQTFRTTKLCPKLHFLPTRLPARCPMLPHHPTPPHKLSRQSALGLTALITAWLVGTASLDRGLVQDGSDIFAILGFLSACTLWFYTRRLLPRSRRNQFIEIVLLGWWALNLALCAATGGELVFETVFFVSCVVATAALFAVAVLTPIWTPRFSWRAKSFQFARTK